uniref:Tetraspanin 32 n=1 Tax=Ornithorhynchus anatinus TaxID=9258 RepID=A0A6I8NCH9_ORNAN
RAPSWRRSASRLPAAFVLLGLSVAILTVITRSGAHFTVLSRASGDGSPYRVLHSAAFYLGTCLAGLLGLGAVLSAAGTVREAAGLVAGGFLCFALVFCTLIQVAFWRHTNRSQVEDAVLDAYDLVYEMAMRNSSGGLRQLEAIHDTYLCCGKNSPFGGPGSLERDLCPGAGAPAGGGPPSPPGGPPGGGGATGKVNHPSIHCASGGAAGRSQQGPRARRLTRIHTNGCV